MGFSTSYTYNIKDRYSSKLAKIRKVTDAFKRTVSKAASKTRIFTKSMKGMYKATKKAGRGIKKVTGKLSGMQNLIGSAAVGMATLFPIKAAIDFESVMADVEKVIKGITPKQFNKLKKEIKLASREAGALPVDVAKIAVAGGKMNIPINKLKGFIDLTSMAAKAFDVLDGDIAMDMARIANRIKLPISKINEMMDAINFLADNTAASAGGMIEVIGRVSTTMSGIKMPPELISGWAAFAEQVEVTPRLAASGLKMMIEKMRLMPRLAKKMAMDPHKTIVDELKRISKIPALKRPKYLTKIFGVEPSRFIAASIDKMELLEKTIGKVSKKHKFLGSMMRELEIKKKTAAFKLKQLRAAYIGLAIDIGTTLLPVIKEIAPVFGKIATAISKFVKKNPELTKFIVLSGLAFAAVAPLALAIGALFNPVTLIVGAMALLGVKLGFVAKNSKTLKPFFTDIWKILKNIDKAGFGKTFTEIGERIDKQFPRIKKGFNELKEIFIDIKKTVTDTIERIDKLMERFETLTKPLKILKPVGGVFSALKYLWDPGSLPEQPVEKPANMAADYAKKTTNTLNGRIGIDVTGPGKVTRSEMATSVPGNLGFNMAGG